MGPRSAAPAPSAVAAAVRAPATARPTSRRNGVPSRPPSRESAAIRTSDDRSTGLDTAQTRQDTGRARAGDQHAAPRTQSRGMQRAWPTQRSAATTLDVRGQTTRSVRDAGRVRRQIDEIRPDWEVVVEAFAPLASPWDQACLNDCWGRETSVRASTKGEQVDSRGCRGDARGQLRSVCRELREGTALSPSLRARAIEWRSPCGFGAQLSSCAASAPSGIV